MKLFENVFKTEEDNHEFFLLLTKEELDDLIYDYSIENQWWDHLDDYELIRQYEELMAKIAKRREGE